MSDKCNITKLPHHTQEKLCQTRPPYRQGRKLTAVKVYTVNDESQHLLICGVPKIQLCEQVKQLVSPYGDIKDIHLVSDYPSEEFTEVFHIHYRRIQSARIAKRFIDGKNFYGGLLHVCYAPELESVSETRAKLNQRRRDVLARIKRNREDPRNPETDPFIPENQYHRKKKTPALPLTEERLKRFYPSESLQNGHSDTLTGSHPESFSELYPLPISNSNAQNTGETTSNLFQAPYQLTDPVLNANNRNVNNCHERSGCKRKNYRGKVITDNVKVKIIRSNIIDTRNILSWNKTDKNVFTNVKKVDSGITIKVINKCDDSKKRIIIKNPSTKQLVQPSEELQLSIQSAKSQIRAAMQKNGSE